MDIVTLLSTDRIAIETEVSSTKRTFEILSDLLCRDTSDSEMCTESVFDALVSREKLGSTALGNGIAVPHTCMPIEEPKAALLLMEEGLKMDAPDKKPVHLLVVLLIPETNNHTYRPLLRELTLTINRKGLYQDLLEYKDPSQVLDYLSSLFIRDIAA